MNRCLRFWQYFGNHSEGRDHARHNRWGIPLEVVLMGYAHPQAKIKYSRKDSFGREVDVSLPVEEWQKLIEDYNAWVAKLKRQLEEAGLDSSSVPAPSPNLQ